MQKILFIDRVILDVPSDLERYEIVLDGLKKEYNVITQPWLDWTISKYISDQDGLSALVTHYHCNLRMRGQEYLDSHLKIQHIKQTNPCLKLVLYTGCPKPDILDISLVDAYVPKIGRPQEQLENILNTLKELLK